jgi:mono/diheme cytochrome c family protein
MSASALAQTADLGKTIYTQRCMTCHQVDGSGAQNMIPPLIRTDYTLGEKSDLIKTLLNGMTGEIVVNGDGYSGEMPSVKDLSDAEIAAVLTYVRKNFGNNESAVTEMEVKKVRDSNIK